MEKIYGICSFCDGRGANVMDGEGATCPRCEGSGRQFLGEIDLDDIKDKLSDILDKCKDIFEKVSEKE